MSKLEINKFYNCTAEDLMKEMISKGTKVNNIISSPPYGNSRGKTKNSLKQSARDNHEVRYDVFLENRTDEEYIKWMIELFNDFDKILAENGTILWNINYATDNQQSKSKKDRELYQPNTLLWKLIARLIEETNFTTADKLIWKKSNALPNNSSHNKLTRIVEEVFVFCRKDEYDSYITNKQVKSQSRTGQKYYENIYNFVEAKNNDGSNKLNKATFSTDLITRLIDIYGVHRDDTENIIFDPFMGTGTTANACVIKGFNYVGSEISEAQVEYSKKRIEETIKSLQP